MLFPEPCVCQTTPALREPGCTSLPPGGALIGNLFRCRSRGDQRHPHRLAHGVELVVAGDLLDGVAVVLLKEDEVAQVIEEQFAVEEAFDHLLQLVFEQRLVVLVAQGAPGEKALLVGGQRAQARRQAIGDHQRLVADEEVGDFVLVGLQLVVGLPDVGVDIGGVLQLDHRDRQAVDEDDDIGAAQLLAPLDGELVDDQKLVALPRKRFIHP
jgi:hypothetical protein